MPSKPVRLCRRLPSGRSRALCATAFTVASAAVIAPPASAAGTFYVDPAGLGGRCSDARSPAENTLARPWCTLRRALDVVPSGGRLELRAGSYPATVHTGFTRPAPVTLAPFGAETPVLARLELVDASSLNVERLTVPGGFTVRGGSLLNFSLNVVDAKPAGRSTPAGFSLHAVHSVNVRGNIVRDTSYGVHVRGSIPVASDVLIQGNRFAGIGYDGVHVSGGTRVTIDGNDFDDVKPRPDIDARAHSDAIQSEAPTQDVTVSDNVVRGGRGFLFMVAVPEQTRKGYGHRSLTIQNNLLVGYDFGMRLFSTSGLRLVNNTVWGTSDSPQHGVNILNRTGTANLQTTGVVMANNILKRFGFAAPVTFAVRTANLIANGPLAPGDLQGAPSFAASGAFGLRAGSPGIDRALASLAPPADLIGSGRFGPPDVGALEYRP